MDCGVGTVLEVPNMSILKRVHFQKERIVFQASFFRHSFVFGGGTSDEDIPVMKNHIIVELFFLVAMYSKLTQVFWTFSNDLAGSFHHAMESSRAPWGSVVENMPTQLMFDSWLFSLNRTACSITPQKLWEYNP